MAVGAGALIRHRVGAGKRWPAILHLQLHHLELEFCAIHLHQAIVVGGARFPVCVLGLARNRIRRCSAAAGHNVGHALVLVTLIVMDVAAEDDKARAGLELPFFQHFCQRLLAGARRVPASQKTLFGVGVRRVMQQEKDKIYVAGKVVELVGQPLSLGAARLILRAV